MTLCGKAYLCDLCLHKLLLPPLNPLARLSTRGDKRERDLPTILIRHSNDANIRYERVIEEMTLEFCRCDLKTANFHDLLHAVNDKKIVIDVDDSFITRTDPSSSASS